MREGGFTIITFKRKILTAILSSLLFTLIFSIFGGFEVNSFFNLYYLNLLVAITYGVIASFISDLLSTKLFKGNNTREISSLLIHCCFGLPFFLIFGLVSAILFFIIDRLLVKVRVGWISVIIGVVIVVVVFIILINR